MKIMSSVKDLVLNYAFNMAKNKNEDVDMSFQDQLLSGIEILRSRYPELLFVNYAPSITDDESKEVFLSIKSKVSEHYRISFIPSVLSFVEVIGNQRIEIPGVIKMEDGGYLCIRYNTNEMKKALLNQVIIHLLIQLPIKRINFSFVDLCGNYDEDFFIKNVNSSIYHGKPITSDIQLEDLLGKLEQRRFDITQKYGEYPNYCQEHGVIPIPYEFIVLLDDYYDDRFRQRLNNIINTGYKYGVYVILFQNTSGFQFPDNCILNPNGNELYFSGQLSSFSEEYCNYSGDFYYLSDKQNDCIPHIPISNYDLLPNYIANGYGDYEVVLSVKEMTDNTNMQNLYSVFCNEMGIPKNRVDAVMVGADVVLSAFPTEEAANDYIDRLCIQYNLPESITCCADRIFLEPCWRKKGFLNENIHLGLWIPQTTCNNIQEYVDDLKFYMEHFNVSGDLFTRLLRCVCGEIPLSHATRYIDSVEMKEYSSDGANFVQSLVVGHMQKQGDYYLYNFDRETEVYIDDAILDLMPFVGIAVSYWDNPKYDKEVKCRDYIFGIEHDLHKLAINKWGKYYYRSHLYFGRTPPGVVSSNDDGYWIKVRKKLHSRKAIWKYEKPVSNGLINYTPITENKQLLNAFLNYVNTEAVAKEERKAISLDYSNSASSYYDIPDNEISTSIGMTETNEIQFRMDLVSHVHSFIIGQSGSGKSVFHII